MTDISLRALDWDAFRVILAIDREGSLSGGARALGVNQATVARHLGRAEKAMDAKLFHRLSNGLFSTDAGKIAVSYAMRIENEVISANQKLLASNATAGGVIRFSIPLNLMSFGLAEDIRAFQDEHPEVMFEITATDNITDFLRRQVDVVLRADNNPTSGLWGYRLVDIHYSLFANSQFQIKWGDQIAKSPQTVPLPVILLSSGNRDEDRQQVLARFPKARFVAECNNLESVLPLVKSGAGLARLPRFMAAGTPDLHVIAAFGEELAKTLWVLTHPDYRDVLRVREFMEFLLARYESRASEFV